MLRMAAESKLSATGIAIVSTLLIELSSISAFGMRNTGPHQRVLQLTASCRLCVARKTASWHDDCLCVLHECSFLWPGASKGVAPFVRCKLVESHPYA